MRAIFFFFIIIAFQMAGCASVELAKGVTKATKSLETSIKKVFEKPDIKKTEQKIVVEEEMFTSETEKEQKILVEEQKIYAEQKMASNVVKEQKKVSMINLLGKTMKQLKQQLGQPRLIREDGRTITMRFDSKSCRFFVFMNSAVKTPHVEYYELRNNRGDLIERQKNMELCFKEIKPV